MQNSAVRLKAIKTGGNSMNPTPAMSLNLLSGAISSLVTFSRSTVATVTDFEGVIKNTKINEARFDGMRRVENLLAYSQAIGGTTGWSNNATTSTVNNVSAPDGTTTASKLTEDATTNSHYVGTTTLNTIISGQTYNFSIYLKKGTGATAPQYVQFNAYTSSFNCGIVIDLNAGTIYSTLYIGGATVSSSSVNSIGKGWYKYTFTTKAIANSGAANAPAIVFINNNPALAIGSGSPSYLGATTSDVYCWGAMVENVTGQTNQNPSEYVSTNVLSYPYQGAGVDGVQYFNYTNPNCAINGVLTQIPTTPINSSNSKWAYNCTTAGDYFSTPSSTANRITGDLSLLAQVALDDWTPTTVQCLIVKDGVSAGTRSWAFNVQTSGAPRLNYSLDGTNILSATATVATGFTDRTVHYVGVQRESSTGIIRFYTSEDGRTFTQLGADVAGTAGALYDATTQPVQFGNLSGLSFALDGKIYDSHVYNGLKFTGTSTMVMDFDPSNWTSGTTFTGLETGEIWTLNGNAKIYQGLWDATGPSSLLIEESRTNLVTYSSVFDVGWVKDGGISVTANQNIAPDGTQAMDLLSRVSGVLNAFAQLYNLVSVGAGGNVGKNYTFSVWVQSQSGTVNGSLAISDFNYATTQQNFTATTTPTRLTFTSATVWNALGTYIAAGINLASVNTQIYIWGAQLEVGSFATSYIPTTSAAVTRTADSASMTGTNFSSWYNQAQGSLYVDFDLIGLKGAQGMEILSVLNASGSGMDLYNVTLGTQILSYLGASSSLVISSPAINTKYKALLAYTQTNLNTYINGATPITLSGTLPANIIALGLGFTQTTNANYMSGHIRKLSYYPIALSSANLQGLTS